MSDAFTVRLFVEGDGFEPFEKVLNKPDALVVGRASDCSIVIGSKEAGLSRHHCLIDVNPPVLTVEDLGSTNGTLVNGTDVGDTAEPSPLRSGDVIELANASIKVETVGFAPNASTFASALPPRPQQPAVASTQTSTTTIPDEIKGYRIAKRIGGGSGGDVYLALEPETGERVALKTMTADSSVDVERKAMFIRESDTMRDLSHPNIVRMTDAGYAEPRFFIAMEYCDGGNLESVVEHYGGRLRLDKARVIILDVLNALKYLHEWRPTNSNAATDGFEGIIHRDVKPANILLKSDGDSHVVKLGDFGLAKAMTDAGLKGITRTGRAGGTMAFTCRQQILNYKHVRPEVDVWSCAAVLYYLVSGHPPRDMKSVKNPMAAVLETEVVPLARRLPDAPAKFAILLDSALDDRSELRFKSAAEFAEALRELPVV